MSNNEKREKFTVSLADSSTMFTRGLLDEIASRVIQKDINEGFGLVGVRHAGDFCDGCTCDDKVCETCPWAQYVPDTRK